MKTPLSLLLRAALVALVLFVGHSTAVAQDADTVFKRLSDKYQSIDALRAEFTQTMTSSFLDQEESFSGSLILKGDNYRIETGSETLIVTDSETVVYRPSEQQVLINDNVEDEEQFSPSEFLLNYDKRFNILSVESDQIDGAKYYRIDLEPKEADSFFLEATMWMRDSDSIITRLSVLDVNETRMVFSLDKIELNPTLTPDTFELTPPDGVEVIDLRS